ncbi:hypothetical protein [Nocardioides campestrisoli]|uniref:hypothetical protein n=1 Tax=Nocardioides campestrisoli TaxID=2736757 RepID=UPI0015E670AD|nr:hypothetical protein [Nocardioides campestrisoli]
MRRTARLATAAVASLALAFPIAAVTATSASAAPANGSATAADASTDVFARKAKKKIKLKKAKPGTHYGLAGNKITAQVRGKGKVTFTVNGTKVKKKIKKGKASFRLPAELGPGTYKVKAKYKKSKGTIKTIVWDSALNVNEANFTISLSTPSYDYPDMVGTVKFKGKTPNTGYVDIYRDGKNKGGSGSPNYCCMDGVGEGGAFSFSGSYFLGKVAENGPGTYQYRAFYTPTSSFDEYIYSQWITVTVVP